MKMKKIMSIILASAMVLAMAACGSDSDKKSSKGSTAAEKSGSQTDEDADNDADTDDETGTTDDGSAFPEALSSVEAYPVEDISNTSWTLSGGMINGTEMEQGDLEGFLAASGGTFQFAFPSADEVQMVNGEQTFEGSYQFLNENYAIEAVFDGYEYYGVFTQIEGETVLILANKTAPETALYMTQIS